jgi:XPA protein C-terminus
VCILFKNSHSPELRGPVILYIHKFIDRKEKNYYCKQQTNEERKRRRSIFLPLIKAMAPLTEEQRERIRINRERALEIQRRKKEERRRQQEQQPQQQISTTAAAAAAATDKNGDSPARSGKRKLADKGEPHSKSNGNSSGGVDGQPSSSSSVSKKSKNTDGDDGGGGQATTATPLPSFLDDGLPIESFEEGGSEWVTKSEAMNTYCLSESTIAVLKVVEERENPHNKSWKPMKLYRRSEVRAWAHKRWNGLDNLQKERDRRQERKFEKQMKDADDIFK